MHENMHTPPENGFQRNLSYFKKNTAKSGHPVSRCLKSKPEMLPNNGSKFHHNLVLIRLPMILDLTINNSEPSYILLLKLWCNAQWLVGHWHFHFTLLLLRWGAKKRTAKQVAKLCGGKRVCWPFNPTGGLPTIISMITRKKCSNWNQTFFCIPPLEKTTGISEER